MADRTNVAVSLLSLLMQAVLLISAAPQPVAAEGTNLTMAVFLSGLDRDGDRFTGRLDGRAFQEAVKLALQRINSRSDILPGYTLEARYADGQVRTRNSKILA